MYVWWPRRTLSHFTFSFLISHFHFSFRIPISHFHLSFRIPTSHRITLYGLTTAGLQFAWWPGSLKDAGIRSDL